MTEARSMTRVMGRVGEDDDIDETRVRVLVGLGIVGSVGMIWGWKADDCGCGDDDLLIQLAEVVAVVVAGVGGRQLSNGKGLSAVG
ncbi:hypothetical protein V6N12_009805 [Hibiscus sabdariffa]|uniref:Uncharacterized protein n=1 Tax=Hibiscus sabdariffa TaxID=183260 RepID=A0ABR2EDA8_9ROSI